MAILKMKRLCIIAPQGSARGVLRSLASLGCVELEKATPQRIAEYSASLHLKQKDTKAGDTAKQLANSCKLIAQYAPAKKTPLLSPMPEIEEKKFFDSATMEKAKLLSAEISKLGTSIEECSAEQLKLSAQAAALRPWTPLDVSLDFQGTKSCDFFMGTLPAGCDLSVIEAALLEKAPAALIERIFADNEQLYLTVTVHKQQSAEALGILKSEGFVTAAFKDTHGTAKDVVERCEVRITELEKSKTNLKNSVISYADALPALKAACDAFSLEQKSDELLSAVGCTEKTVYLTGWSPENAVPAVAEALEKAGCAYSFEEPQQDEEPPVCMQNSSLIDPVVSVTEMYGVPSYHSLIDPNPSMYPFYVLFFGFIMQDIGYGLLMFFGCYAALKLMKPKGGMKRMLRLFMHCGVTTVFAGALFGGFFADFISVFSKTFLGVEYTLPPLWFNPLNDPMKMLYFSLGLGVVHIVTGMALSAYRMIKQGDVIGAMCDVGSWYVLFIGVGLMAAGVSFGSFVAILGALMLLLTGGRSKKGFFGKLTGGLGSLYGITSYLSDLLSYSRIMALGLSGAVVGQVMNQIATLAGGGVVGFIMFVAVFIIGHAFNLAISLLGAYVHTCRLQYIEFFGKFFEGGGKLFTPLSNSATKYVNVIREE